MFQNMTDQNNKRQLLSQFKPPENILITSNKEEQSLKDTFYVFSPKNRRDSQIPSIQASSRMQYDMFLNKLEKKKPPPILVEPPKKKRRNISQGKKGKKIEEGDGSFRKPLVLQFKKQQLDMTTMITPQTEYEPLNLSPKLE